MAVSINHQILGYILQSGGGFVDGHDDIERWFKEVKHWCDALDWREQPVGTNRAQKGSHDRNAAGEYR